MSWLRHRQPLLLSALLDGLAMVVIAFLLDGMRYGTVLSQPVTLVGVLLCYWGLGWLFGTYSLLRWPRLHWPQLIGRVGLTASATLTVVLLTGWVWHVSPLELPLLQRGSLGPLLLGTGIASAITRAWLHHLGRQQLPQWSALASLTEQQELVREWRRQRGSHNRPQPQLIDPQSLALNIKEPGRLLAISPGMEQRPELQPLLEKALGQGMRLSSLAQLAEEELQRIPPQWLDKSLLQLGQLADGRQRGLSRQLKRFADLLLSALLLLLALPLLLPVALAIYLQDRGPVFYSQIRTGLFGEPFQIHKLRSMSQLAETDGARWSSVGDKRITPLGNWLRRSRLDELPQLLNVIRGEMSLIGPRPERPELEESLEEQIPHYRLRHLVRPGLSGWAQVNMSYASSLDDAELKLSYDLYYLRNASLWLDLMIMAKTIKTVLKGAGR